VTLSNDPVTTASGGTIITIIDKAGHGATAGDTVTISGVSGAIGGISAARLNVEMTVASVPTKATFTADVGGSNASGTATGGGSAVVATYKAGTYYTPTAAHQVMMSDVARHVIAFGCNEIGGTTINPLLVRWSSSEAAGVWQPLSTNSAGGQELSSCSEIVGAMMTRQEILIWTDCGVVSMRYIGSPFYFSFTETAKGMSMVSPNAAVNAGGTVYFMDRGAFYTYTGTALDRTQTSPKSYGFIHLSLVTVKSTSMSSSIMPKISGITERWCVADGIMRARNPILSLLRYGKGI